MAILLITYDLRQPGRDYATLHDYLKQFTYCKGMESVWLLDTTIEAPAMRDNLRQLIDDNDRLFVTPIAHGWAAWNYRCSDWLNDPDRNWK